MADEKAPNPDVETLLGQLRELEERLLASDVRSSREDVSDLLADDFVEFGRSGRVYDRQQTIEALSAEVDRDASIERTARDFRISLLTQGVALLTYRSTRRSAASESVVHSLRSSIWKLTDGRWQMVFHQGTPADGLSG